MAEAASFGVRVDQLSRLNPDDREAIRTVSAEGYLAVHGSEGSAFTEQDGTVVSRQERGAGRKPSPLEPVDTLAEFVESFRTGRAPEPADPRLWQSLKFSTPCGECRGAAAPDVR